MLIASIFIIRMALLLNLDDLDRICFSSCGFIRLIYDALVRLTKLFSEALILYVPLLLPINKVRGYYHL